MKRAILFLFWISFAHYGLTQTDTTTQKYGLILDVNIGFQNTAYHDLKKNMVASQHFLRAVSDEFGPFWIDVGEIGMEAIYLTKSGMLVRGDVHTAKNLFKDVSRGRYVEGNWRGRGMSLGVGSGRMNKSSLIMGSLSLGYYRSNWRFHNDDLDSLAQFGNLSIVPNEVRRVSSNNLYLDLNLKLGPIYRYKEPRSKFHTNNSLTIGYRQSITKGAWVLDRTGERVQDINSTLMMGWYLKLCLGLRYLDKIQ